MKNSSNKIDVRLESIRILRKVDEKDVFLQELVEERCQQANVSRLDKHLLLELVNGITRHQLSLDTILSFFSKIPPKKIEPWLLYALRLGIYQMVFLDKIPHSAAVNTSVELVKNLIRRPDAARFANAILRAVDRTIKNKYSVINENVNPQKLLYKKENVWCEFSEPIFPDQGKNLTSYIAKNYSHPEWLIKRWLTRYGKDKTIEICKANNYIPTLFLRINHNKTSISEFASLLEQKGILARVIDNNALIVNKSVVSDIPGFSDGLFSVQDITSMKVGTFLIAETPTDGVITLLDMCAAPGGKTTHIAEIIQNKGSIYALDISLKRLYRVKENCQRLGTKNITIICGDASEGKIPFRCKFDRVLADVPCSNTGVLSRRVEARWRITEKNIKQLAALQYSLLKTGSTMLKQDGILVYSTCSIEPEENQEVVQKFLKNEPQFCLDKEDCYFPEINKGDGGYMARIRKKNLGW
ncbi:16S rRNA (cytosine(967)-C(5))-methyltransferase RsmB [Candidatus Kuenenia sp.]|uniref:16S rRNA (cytosine(967)-C(5))-methyltransferase RsmB n=1 Tax=Candidatus Kuenenia sp. TaxID=2499824 RepID=UPI00321F8A38